MISKFKLEESKCLDIKNKGFKFVVDEVKPKIIIK